VTPAIKRKRRTSTHQAKAGDAVARPGADLYLAGIADPPATLRLLGASGVSGDELRRRFGDRFEVAEERRGGGGHFVVYHLVRRYEARAVV